MEMRANVVRSKKGYSPFEEAERAEHLRNTEAEWSTYQTGIEPI